MVSYCFKRKPHIQKKKEMKELHSRQEIAASRCMPRILALCMEAGGWWVWGSELQSKKSKQNSQTTKRNANILSLEARCVCVLVGVCVYPKSQPSGDKSQDFSQVQGLLGLHRKILSQKTKTQTKPRICRTASRRWTTVLVINSTKEHTH